jgi:putative ABC transport system permease protein
MSGMRALLRAGLRDLLRRPLQSALMLIGLALGVAVVIAIDLANQSAQRAFVLSTQEVVGEATHRIVGGPTGLPETIYREIRISGGLRNAAPIVEGVVSLSGHDLRPIRLLGIDPFAELPFRDYLDRAAPFAPEFAPFYTAPGQAIVSADLASSLELIPGDDLQVQVNDRLESLRILGVLDRARTGEVLLLDLASAQELLGMVGRLSRIDLIADAELVAQLERSLPPGVQIEPSSAQLETADQLTSAFRLNLTALSLLALIVGVFLVYNTMTFSVLRRRPILGTMRALGATGGQIMALILTEAAFVGAFGSVLGIGIGWLLSKGAVGLVSQTIQDFYFLVSVRETVLGTGQVIKGLALGIGAGCLAAALPAREAASTPPIQVLRRSDLETRALSWLPRLRWAGLGSIGIGTTLFLVSSGSLTATFVGLMLVVVGISVLVPAATKLALGSINSSKVELHTRMALRGVSRHISRAGTAIAALMVALSVAIGVALMINSFRATVENWLAVTLQSDLYISSPTAIGTRPQASLPPELPGQIQAIGGVQHTESLRAVMVGSQFGEVHLSAVDPDRVRDQALYRFADGTAEEVWQAVTNGSVIVSESLALRSGAIDQISLDAADGERILPVVGVFYDYSTDQGTVLMSREVYQRYWEDPFISSIGVMIEEGESLELVAGRIRRELAGTGLAVTENQRVREEALKIFDRTFAITNALRLLAVAVAFVGVLSALLALQLERSREYATLRALGMPSGGLKRLTYSETALMGASAALFSFPTGIVLALALSHMINVRSFGWTVRLELSAAPFLGAAFVGVTASLLAALYPSLRLDRMPVARALSKE